MAPALMLFAPVLAAGLIAVVIHVFLVALPWHTQSVVAVWMGEAGPLWQAVFVVGVAGAWFGARKARSSGDATAAMYFLLPIWGLVLAAFSVWVEGASVIDTNCGPASRETILHGTIGELHASFVLAFAWSAALSVCSALSMLTSRRRDATAAVSLLLAGLSFGAAAFQAGAVRLALEAAHWKPAMEVRSITTDVASYGTLSAWLMLGAVLAGFASSPGLIRSPGRILRIGGLTVVPLICWAIALEAREPFVFLMKERLKGALIIDGLTPSEEKPDQLGGWARESRLVEDLGWHVNERDDRTSFSLQVTSDVSTESLGRVLSALHRVGVRDVQLVGTASGMTPLPFDGIERRIAFSPSATRLRLVQAEACADCDAQVHLDSRGLRVVRPDGSAEVWERKAIAVDTKAEQLPGAEWVGPSLGNQALVDASLIALSHGHVLVLRVRPAAR